MGFLEKLQPLALLLLRCALGLIYLTHGWPKLMHIDNTMQFFGHVGLAPYLAYFIAVLEVFGGCLLIVGLFTRPVALLLAGEMCVAILKVHLRSIYVVKDYEFPMALAAAAFTLATVGAGLVSLDQPIFGRKAAAKSKSKS